MDFKDFLRMTGRREGFGGPEELEGLEELLKMAMGREGGKGFEEFLKSKGLALETRRKDPNLIFAEAQLTGKESEIEHFQRVVSAIHEELVNKDKELEDLKREDQGKEELLKEFTGTNNRLVERVKKLMSANNDLINQLGAIRKGKLMAKINELKKKLTGHHVAKGKVLTIIGALSGNGSDPFVALEEIRKVMLGLDVKPDEKSANTAPGDDAVEQTSQAAGPAQGATAP